MIMAFDGLIHLVVQENDENRRRINRNKAITRQLRDASNAFELPEEVFLKLFRLDKGSCQYLINQIGEHMSHSRRNSRVPVVLRILAALKFFGQGSYQTCVGTDYSLAVSQPVMSRCITEVSNVINQRLSNEWIQFPVTELARNRIKQGFARFTFENCIGIIDGSLIRIVSPPANHPVYPGPAFYCRKHFYAINIQVICDHNKVILNLNARYPGSVHDSAIWMQSEIRRMLERQYVNEVNSDYLIGDSGYPLEPWLLVPCEDPAPGTPESRFNTVLSSTRVYVEHTIGLLKNRFRCMHGQRALYYNPVKVSRIVQTCVILHNICRKRQVEMPQDNNDHYENNIVIRNRRPVVPHDNWFEQGSRHRRQIVNRYFQHANQ